MKTKLIALFIVIFCASSFTLNAQTIKKFALQKVWEVGGSVGFISTTRVDDGNTGSATTAINFQPFGGYFITKSLELGIMPSVTYEKPPSPGSDNIDYTLYFAPAYNFIIQKSVVYPYIMGLIGYTVYNGGGITRSGIAFGGEGGVKINAYGNSLIKLGIQYEQRTLNPSDNPDGNRNGLNNIKFEAGFSVFF
jgi:hypothetical protein